ncbi:MAG TPA: cysteine desulfurase [Firmicutes bacterium]|nr:cysteine desulfurase [Bacillota bacterium]
MLEIYLDNSATTQADPLVVAAMVAALQRDYGNPSSLHRRGAVAERLVTEGRAAVAEALGVAPDEIYFTGSGTEANNLAIKGTAAARKGRGRHIITTAIEHPAVLNACRAVQDQGYQVTYLNVDEQGVLRVADLEAALRPDTILVSVMHVNNEVGSVQPIRQIGALLQSLPLGQRPYLHVDAVQSFGRLELDPQRWGIDMVAISAHKLHGPKGIGALWVRSGVQLVPLIDGGEQERGLRSGTENVPGIVGFGVAARQAHRERAAVQKRMTAWREKFIARIRSAIPSVRLNGPEHGAAPHIINLAFPGLPGEQLVHFLESKGVYVSTGSACSSRQPDSHVLRALGVPREAGAIRLSLSRLTTEAEMDQAADVLVAVVRELQRLYKGRG